MGFKKCNLIPCVQICPGTRPTLVCNSKVDIILLLDGSGSTGDYGFKQSKALVGSLLKAFQGGTQEVRVALLLFSGPSTWMAKHCVAKAGQLPTTVKDIEQDCKMKWVSK